MSFGMSECTTKDWGLGKDITGPIGVKDPLKGKTCHTHDAIRWVADKLYRNDLKMEDAPSGEAWSLYRYAKDGKSGKDYFWTRIYPNVIPSKQIIEERRGLQDDGEAHEKLLDTIERRLGL